MAKKGDTPHLKEGREKHILNVTKKHFYPLLKELNNKVNFLSNKINNQKNETRTQTIHTHNNPVNINPTLKLNLFNEVIGIKFFPIETKDNKKEKVSIEQLFEILFRKINNVSKKTETIESQNQFLKSENLKLKKKITELDRRLKSLEDK